MARDFNQDGRADLAVAQAAESQILVLPARHFLLYKADRIPDGSLVPLSIAVIGIRWGASDGRLAGGLSFLLALCILMTSLAVALSLGIHSIGAHLRF